MTHLQNPYENLLLVGGRLCLDFCNTVEYRDSERIIDLIHEGYSSLLQWSAHVQSIDKLLVAELQQYGEHQEKDAKDLFNQAIQLREAIYALIISQTRGEPISSSALSLLNSTLQKLSTHRILVPTDNHQMAWSWNTPTPFDLILGPIVLSAVDLLVAPELERVRQCPGCNWLFYDQSRNHSRTWCDMQFCGNRSKARRFYQRQKSVLP